MTSTSAAAPASWRERFAGGAAVRLESLIVLAVLCAAMAALSGAFLSVSNILNILLSTSVFGVLAIGMTFVISSAGIDLSVGSILALSGVAGAMLTSNLDLPWVVGILGCLVMGALTGALNGFLITKGAIPPFIVTLGMLGVARGVALVLSDGVSIYGLPQQMVWLGQGRPLGVPTPVIILLLTALVAHVLLAHTRFGIYAQVIGDNEGAARAMGVKVERMKVLLYTLSGLLSGLAGLLFAARINSGEPTAGLSYELTAITATILGGTNLFGGRGSVVGTLIGALIMGVLQNGLNLLAVRPFYQQIAIGAVLILAVWLDRINSKEGWRR
ncbi:MAG TPA: ABC transporter permease [Roseiarcus sp.]|jgi:ribose/xylose/arabinose/galactoside ABC-type transport system permease subunit|nr:ABC transporter permease [Roseiarcus sp.]